MKKEFWKWHGVKEKLNDRGNYAYFYEREIWFCSLGINIGHEQDGKYERFERPVIIFRKLTNQMLWVIPLTTKSYKNEWQFKFRLNHHGKIVENFAMLHQVRLVDSKRLGQKIGYLDRSDFRLLERKFLKFCFKGNSVPNW